jgi:Protein of unknown function (DUF3499)
VRIATESRSPHGTVLVMRRQCARPGCSAVASTTFTFDSDGQVVFLDATREGGARAGELCARHARVLAPPRGWTIVDRRASEPATHARPIDASAPPTVVLPARPPAPAPSTAAWHPRFERGDTLGGVLDASTPLLGRAFRNVRAG